VLHLHDVEGDHIGHIGHIDDPDQQRRLPLLWRPSDGSVIVIGSPGSGVSSTLRTLAACALAEPDVHVYVITAERRGWSTFADHPVVRFLRAGVPVTINTDDITVSDISLSEEWLSCIDVLGLTLPELWACNLHALRVAFVDEPTRARLLAEFSEWATSVPEVAA
jgi:adenosine deaminase